MNKPFDINSSKAMEKGAVKASFASRFFLGYDSAEKRLGESFIYKIFSSLSKKFSIIKGFIASSCDNSGILKASETATRKLLEKNLRYYGVALFFFSIFLMAFSSIRDISLYGKVSLGSDVGMNPVIFGAISLFISVVMMSSQKCVAALICESQIFSYVLFRVFCFDILKLQKIKPEQRSHTLPVIFGIVFAFVCVLFSPAIMFGILLFILLAVAILRVPENGVIFVFIALPFLSESLLLVSVGLVCLSYVFKLLRNKRVYKTGLFDVSVFLFALIVLLYGIFSVNNVGSLNYSLIILLFILFGFVISNTMRTDRFIEKCVSALVISSTVVATIGILDFVFGYFELFSGSQIFRDISGIFNMIPFGSKEVYGELITLIIPIAFIRVKLSDKASDRTASFISLIIILLFSALCLNVSIWFSAVFSLIIFMLFLKPKFGLGIICISSIIFVLYVIFPLPFEFFKNLIFNYAEPANSAVVSSDIYEILARFDYLGMGSGADVLKQVSGCMFGFKGEEIFTMPNSFLSFLLHYGIVGVIFFSFMVVTFVVHGTSFCYSEINYNPKMKLYTSACLACIVSMIIKSFFFNVFLSYEALLCAVMVAFISVASKRCAVIEFVPDKIDFTMIDEISIR